jgi:hypothetical protein
MVTPRSFIRAVKLVVVPSTLKLIRVFIEAAMSLSQSMLSMGNL